MQTKNSYNSRIQIDFFNKDQKSIDRYFARNISDLILQTKDIKEVLTVSKDNSLSIYYKYNFLTFNKERINEKIYREISAFINNNKSINESIIYIDDKYYEKYEDFLLLTIENVDITNINKYINNIYSELLKKQITNKIMVYNNPQKTLYINFNYQIMKKFKLCLEDFKNIILNYNSKKNVTQEETNKNKFKIEIKNKILSIEDLKNMNIYYPNSNFHTKAGNILNIYYKNKEPLSDDIYLNNDRVAIFAISKKNSIPNIIYTFRLKKFIKEFNETTSSNVKLSDFKTNRLKSVTLIYDNYLSIEALNEERQKLNSIINPENKINIIYLIGQSVPKIDNSNELYEANINTITILFPRNNYQEIKKQLLKHNYKFYTNTSKTRKFINKNHFSLLESIENIKEENEIYEEYTYLKNKIFYIPNPEMCSKYHITNVDLSNELISHNEGYYVDSFTLENEEIEIYLKNKETPTPEFLYSKKYDSLIDYNSLVDINIDEKNYAIIRKNGDFYTKIIYL